ncbi:hypothetical protein niasHS_016797 [Heterodera schachtii]|uniref:FLYWCH-type domain-containing protein n=1 Tax=Heterodera schachtii TaxID=97005 RepID=A0ABD2HPP0_HETSC
MLSSSSSSAPEEGELDEDVAEENQPIIQQQRFDLLKSSSQRDILSANGYEYHFEAYSRTEQGIEYWKCVKRRPYCPGRVHVAGAINRDGDVGQYKLGVISNSRPNHPPVHVSVRRGQMELRRFAEAQNPPPTRQAIDDVRTNIPPDIRATQAQSSSAMGRSFRNYVAQARAEVGDDLLDSPE